MKESIIAAYDELACDYEYNVDTKNAYNIHYERPAMIKLLPANLKNIKVLDAGCAACWYTEKLVKLGAEVIATDISTEMVAPYSKTCWKQGKGAEFRP